MGSLCGLCLCVCLFFMLADLLPEFRLLGIQQQNVSQVWPLHILAPQNLIIGQEIVGLVMSLFFCLRRC